MLSEREAFGRGGAGMLGAEGMVGASAESHVADLRKELVGMGLATPKDIVRSVMEQMRLHRGVSPKKHQIAEWADMLEVSLLQRERQERADPNPNEGPQAPSF